jgi:predicted Rossmann-fold nucleotide-binding protein
MTLLQKKTISPEDLKLFIVTDSVDKAVEHIQNNTLVKYNLVKK